MIFVFTISQVDYVIYFLTIILNSTIDYKYFKTIGCCTKMYVLQYIKRHTQYDCYDL